MAGRADQKEESRARILASAGRGFRSRGYGGLGVDELAKQAGVTSGAFYAHFKSKAAAFLEAVGVGMDDLRSGVTQFRQSKSKNWLGSFIDFYMGERRRAALPDSCALQSLTGDVARADTEAKRVFEAKLEAVLLAMTGKADDGADAVPDRAMAIALLALLSGGVSLARAVDDVSLQEEISSAVQQTARRLAQKTTRARKQS
jgi:AcrR family transcriptional regulator